jgi:catechol 2,3-dioxygenase-like lactoylglutathione lyase family enzyme
MPETRGVNHLGLSVFNLDKTTRFFTEALGWTESGRDNSYPRTAVTDGFVRLTLWQVDHHLTVEAFNRRKNVGLHHLALEVDSESRLHELAQALSSWPGVTIEFPPELLGKGPRKHMMLLEPGGIRLELIWPGT